MGGGLAMVLSVIFSFAFSYLGLLISPITFNMMFLVMYTINSYRQEDKLSKLKMINEAICHYMGILIIIVISSLL